jgi:hypothetical protein
MDADGRADPNKLARPAEIGGKPGSATVHSIHAAGTSSQCVLHGCMHGQFTVLNFKNILAARNKKVLGQYPKGYVCARNSAHVWIKTFLRIDF